MARKAPPPSFPAEPVSQMVSFEGFPGQPLAGAMQYEGFPGEPRSDVMPFDDFPAEPAAEEMTFEDFLGKPQSDAMPFEDFPVEFLDSILSNLPFDSFPGKPSFDKEPFEAFSPNLRFQVPAAEAPVEVPGVSSASDATVVPIASTFAAKGGTPGRPDNNDGGSSGDDGDTGGDGVLNEYFSGSADGDNGYDIWLDFKGSGWTVELQSTFTAAADYLTTVITDDIGGGGRYRGKTIDDIYVTAELATIDGAGGVLGQAGPTAVWTANDLTAAGQMEFDVADATDYLSSGLWDDIVTHEFFHVLGFGSLWNYGDHALVENNQYIGQQALNAYDDAFIPVEDGGGAGTIGAHWDEQALDNELMTGYINDDGDASTNDDNYLSEFSVMSLADLGYAVLYQDYPYDGLVIA